MRPLRYSINLTVDGCVDHRAGMPDAETHQRAADLLARADALIFGRVTYQLMEDGWRHTPPPGTRPEWMESFADVINAAKKYVVSSTLPEPDWDNAELLRGDVVEAVRALKDEPGDGLLVGGVTLPKALAEAGLIDEYEFLIHPRLAGHGPYLAGGLGAYVDLDLVNREQLASGVVVLTYAPRRSSSR